ncbi:Uncharacterized protein FWK35_00011307 [Aphis craccivora]|uniref:Uncharacterized protein n=1 Tax=Aphis craccivora TaxID=307492 RepID=A0A6G0YWD5_APHCR|nr:Uncharacterized protein FWK35_00011307 [Aphis craccivora]
MEWYLHLDSLLKFGMTNNFSEGWNRSFNQLVGSANPSFWSVLRSLQLDKCAIIRLNKWFDIYDLDKTINDK